MTDMFVTGQSSARRSQNISTINYDVKQSVNNNNNSRPPSEFRNLQGHDVSRLATASNLKLKPISTWENLIMLDNFKRNNPKQVFIDKLKHARRTQFPVTASTVGAKGDDGISNVDIPMASSKGFELPFGYRTSH